MLTLTFSLSCLFSFLRDSEDDVEKSLNDEFNDACEQAFAPCRLFYAEQDKSREQHAKSRKSIIEQVTTLANSLSTDIDFKQVEAQANKLNKLWREAGDVDRSQYQTLLKQFNNEMAPIKTAIANYHQENSEAKLALINKTKQLLASELTLDTIFNAANTVKDLQATWRTIGYAGAKQDNTLWQDFRQLNDQIFAKRDALKKAQLAEQDEVKGQFQKTLAALKEQLTDKNSVAQNAELLKQAQALHADVIAQKPVIKSVAAQVEKFIETLERANQEINSAKSQQVWKNLFNVIETFINDNTLDVTAVEGFSSLTAFWQKKLQEVTKSSNGDRVSKTLELEILGGIESPKEYAAERLAKQVHLMQEQMLSGNTIDLKAHFVDWLLQGSFSKEDANLLTRIKPLFC